MRLWVLVCPDEEIAADLTDKEKASLDGLREALKDVEDPDPPTWHTDGWNVSAWKGAAPITERIHKYQEAENLSHDFDFIVYPWVPVRESFGYQYPHFKTWKVDIRRV